MDDIPRWARNVLIGTAVVLLVLAVTLAIVDRVAAATLVAGLFLIVSLFCYLPQMESFKAYGVEAKWREKLSKADEILQKLHQSALVTAELTYLTLGWGTRYGGMTARRKQTLIDKTDTVLVELGVDTTKVSELRKSYLFFARHDLYQLFDSIVRLNISENTRPVNIPDQADPAVKDLMAKRAILQKPRPKEDLLEILPNVEFRRFCLDNIPVGGISMREEQILSDFAERLADLVEECQKTQRVVEKAVDLIDRYNSGGTPEIYKELFDHEPLV